MGKHAKLKEKPKWSEGIIHLENARKLRGIYFIDPEDTEFNETIKNARKKLETSVAPAMPCKILKKNCGSGASNKIKTKLACILEADESTRMSMGNSIPHHHEDHIAGKGENSLQHYKLVHKFIPMPQAMKIPATNAAVDKEWEKLEKISAWNLTKVKSKKQVIEEARTWPGGRSPRQASNRRQRTRDGPEPACVQTPLCFEVAHAGGGRSVAKTSSETQRKKSRAARKGKWPPRGTGTTVLTYP